MYITSMDQIGHEQNKLKDCVVTRSAKRHTVTYKNLEMLQEQFGAFF